jgi:hypothetical protein
VVGALLALLAAPAAAQVARFDVLWVPPARDGALPVATLVTLPPLWQNGDAAVVLLFDPPAPLARRHAVVEALLAEGAAVVELDPNTAQGFSPESDADPPPPTPASLREDLDAALWVLAQGWTHGLLVAIGHGQGAEVVLEAAREAGSWLAAAVGLTPDGPVFQAGTPPRASEGWPLRAPLLCRAVARAEQLGAEQLGADAERACVAALLGPGRLAEAR